MANPSPNAALIGVPASRAALATPALVLDLDAVERNIAVHAQAVRAAGFACRPHGKTHKAPAIARMQIAAGAVGICCATVKEAAAFVEAGIEGVLLTTPVVSPAKIARLAALAQASGGALSVVVDSPLAVTRLADAARAAGTVIPVLVDLDIGPGRTGVRGAEAAAALVAAIRDSGTLSYRGVQAYSGLIQHIAGYADRAAAYRPQLAVLDAVLAHLTRAGMAPDIVSGGGTGSFAIDAEAGLFTEHQAGSYCVMDVEYADIEMLPDRANPFEHALFVATTVISANGSGHVTTDAGIKAFAMDGPPPRFAGPKGGVPGYAIAGDEHGAILCDEAEHRFPLGATAELVVPHCDPTVNLYDHYHCVRGDRLVDIWPIDARGSN
ncbi:DSD1 family PLP-dependent enzyme [Sphingomonas flavalba]|uniref:DSD1 family PLP-dependent enzyme n=1 Tax=Sphingomonas flavalba TaxID=2559804 RepID=UPI0039E16957